MINILKLLAAAAVPLVATLAIAAPASSAGELTSTASGVSGGVLFGGDQGLYHDEAKIGRQLAAIRVYDSIGNVFPLPGYDNLMAAGHTLVVSLDSQSSSYAAIAAGRQDSRILPFLTAMNQAAVHYNLNAIYISFEHEPDNPKHRSLGTPGQFIQAWDHVHQLAKTANLDWDNGGRLHWTWIMIRNSFSNPYASEFWPGASQVDIIGIDGYNNAGCNSKIGQTPAAIFGPALTFAAANGNLPVFITEWASTNNPVGTQPDYIYSMQAYVAANPMIAAVLYWNTAGVGTGCNYTIDSDPASIRALYTMGHSSAMQGYLN